MKTSSLKIAELSGKTYRENKKAFRIVADHMRTATFILGDDRGMAPSNVGQGYVLRRLIRRAVRYGMELSLPEGFTGEIARVIIGQYQAVYPELSRNSAFVLEQLSMEETRFAKTLEQGTREFEKIVARLGGKADRRQKRVPPVRYLRLPHRDDRGARQRKRPDRGHGGL